MKRICFLSDNNMSKTGGEQRIVTSIVNMLSKHYEVYIYCKFDSVDSLAYPLDPAVHLISLADCPELKSRNKLNGSMRWFNFRTAIFEKLGRYELVRSIKYPHSVTDSWIAFLNQKQYDSVIGISGFFGMMMMVEGSKVSGKCYSWFHNSFDAYFNYPKKYCWGYKMLLDRAAENIDGLVVLTEADRQCYLRQYQFPVTAISNPLSFCSAEKTDSDQKRIIFVGRMAKVQKGLDLLLEILDQILTKKPDWHIMIAGDGSDMQYFRESIRKSTWCRQVELLGNIKDIIPCYLCSSIALNTSRWEGFGLVVTEAMECGLPVVAFRTDGPSEIINDGVNGFLVNNYDTVAFSDKLLYLMENTEERKKMGQNAIMRAKDYSEETIARQWVKLLEE